MPRPEKYSSPEMRAVAHDYHVLKRQQDLRAKCITKLGSKCDVCGTTKELHLKLVGDASKSWNKRWASVKSFPDLFSLRCANCCLEASQRAIMNKLEELSNVLFKDAMNMKQCDTETVNTPTQHTLDIAVITKKVMDEQAAKIENENTQRRLEDERFAELEKRRQEELNETHETTKAIAVDPIS